MKPAHAELLRYAIAGVINTAVGYITFLIALHGLGLSATWSNAVSYAVGLTCAYVLNGLFVFKTSQFHWVSALRFCVSFILAFALNILTLNALMTWIELRPEIAQIFAMVVYTITFYLLNKLFVFKETTPPPKDKKSLHA